MKNVIHTLTTVILLSLTSCSETKQQTVSYSKHVSPILNSHCLECHKAGGKGFISSGLSMESYDALMKGTKFGPVIKPGDAISSTLVRLISGKADPSINMPHGNRQPLSAADIEQVENWIQQGAKNN